LLFDLFSPHGRKIYFFYNFDLELEYKNLKVHFYIFAVRGIPISVPDSMFPRIYRIRINIESGDLLILNQHKSAQFLVYDLWGLVKINIPIFGMGWF
jgi:hypothetical protein